MNASTRPGRAFCVALLWTLAACGQSPSFTQHDNETLSGTGSATATGGAATSGAPGSGDAVGANGQAGAGSTAGVDAAGAAAAAAGKTAGAGGTKGAGGVAGSGGAGGAGGSGGAGAGSGAGAGAGGGTGAGGSTASGLSPAQVAALPGTQALRVGVNFEDLGPYGDKDFNDSVLCFTGAFKVDGARVVSTARQQVVIHATVISACRHDIAIRITNPDGSVQPPIQYDDAAIPANLTMDFQPGSVLDVMMRSYTEPCTDDGGQHPDLGAVHDMSDPVYAKVLPNQCNTTGQ